MYSIVAICCCIILELQLSTFYLSGLLGVFSSSLYRFKFVPKGDLERIFFLTNRGYAYYFYEAEKQLEKAKKKFCFH